jgi:hypothetical protein
MDLATACASSYRKEKRRVKFEPRDHDQMIQRPEIAILTAESCGASPALIAGRVLERQVSPDLLDHPIGRFSRVYRNGFHRLLQTVHLAYEQLFRHEVLPPGHPFLEEGHRPFEIDQPRLSHVAHEDFTIGGLQRGTSEDDVSAFIQPAIDQFSENQKPRQAIGIGERDPTTHLVDV